MKTALCKTEELGDDDIIEVVRPAPGRSGTYAAVRPPPLPSHDRGVPKRRSDERERHDSMPDGAPTGVSEMVGLLARLSDPGTLPRLTAPLLVGARREPAEALILNFVESNMTVQGIVGMSPLGEGPTLRVLAKLVLEGTVTLVD
jgi:hypothetical protein